jgi:cytosine/adenosine deaminase-related metal-dependent hydrolase
MGQADRRGTIETGKVVDLVLLDRDSLADTHSTHSVRAVVLGGKLLDVMLAEAEARDKIATARRGWPSAYPAFCSMIALR